MPNRQRGRLNASQRHHLVSKGYQKNFADGQQRLTIINARSGVTIERLRPARRNWVEDDWNTFWEESGDPNRHLEQEFARIEAGVMRRIREVRPGAVAQAQLAAVINLAAIHLVRSRSFIDFLRHVRTTAMPDLVDQFTTDPELLTRFEAQHGRRPDDGEVRSLVLRVGRELMTSRRSELETVIAQHNKIAELLTKNTLQVLTIADDLPGLPIGDAPVVHANLDSARFGFRDRLAIGDANLILVPLTRRVAACLTRSPMADTTIGSMHQWKRVVDIQIRACLGEIAAHPDDAHAVARLCRYPLKRPMRRTRHGIRI
ncbi:MAG: DUF4238 domain-containing protein [Acidimicrobiia bacterium]